MDKQTLSNYGWLVMVTLVLAIMLALATPFGSYIKTGVENTTQGLFDTSEKAMNVVGMSAKVEYYYFDTLFDATNALNNNDFTNASKDELKSVMVIKKQGKVIIQLLRNTKEMNVIEIFVNCTIDLNDNNIEIEETINLNENVKCTINNGTFFKNIDSNEQNGVLLNMKSNSVLMMNNVSCNINNDAYVTTKIISIPNTTQNAKLLMNNCKLNTVGSEKQNHTETTPKSIYNIYVVSPNTNVVLNNCESTITGVRMYNIYCGSSANIAVNNGYYKNISVAQAINPNNPENTLWSTYVFNFRNDVVASLDGVTSDSECFFENPQVNILLVGNATLNLKNSKISTNGEHKQFVYTISLQGNQSENIPYAYIENCEITNKITGNPRAIHIYGQSKVDCINSKIASNGMGIFMNHLPQNICNIKNCHIKAFWGVYLGHSDNIYNEENVTYDVDNRIFY